MNPYVRRPYIGIAGIASIDEARHALQIRGKLGMAHHLLAIGLLTTDKTFTGEPKRNHASRYPSVEVMKSMLAGVTHGPQAIVLLHHAPSSLLGLTQVLGRAVNTVGVGVDGVQINASGVSYRDIGPLRRLQSVKGMQSFRVVLQLRLAEIELGDIERLLDTHVAPTSGTIDDVLLDASCGEGVPLDVAKAGAFIERIRAKYRSGLGIGIAGGITPENIGRLKPLVDAFGPDLSIDVESGVRDCDDRYSTKLAAEYLRVAFALFGEG